MPAITKCHVKGCTFDGNHGFGTTYGGIMRFYHTIDENNWRSVGNTHIWYCGRNAAGVDVSSESLSEVFEKTVAPRVLRENKPGNKEWLAAVRAEIAGKPPRTVKRMFAAWHKAATI